MIIKNKRRYFAKLESEFGRLSFADAIKAYRISEDLSQSEFAKKLNLSVQNLNDLEKGRKIPSPSRVSKIAKKIKLPEMPLIQLALRDALSKEGFKYDVKLEAA